MIIFKIVRKIGKILRGGAGRKEIFLGALCGVLIGFNPVAGLTLALAILITLLLNANVAFTLLGAALGKILSLLLATVSFHTGYFIIHNCGLEPIFTGLVNAPVTAMMDLDVYAMTGGLFYALIIGSAFGIILGKVVHKTREKMLAVEQHELIGKTLGKKITRFLLWLAFGKQKLTLEEMIEKQAPTFRKSGLVVVGSAIVIGLVLEFFLLDVAVKSSLQSAIAANTGAEVNIAKAHLSLANGKLEIEGLEITDPDKPTHNLIQIDTLAADVSVSDLLRRTYTIEKLTGSTLKRDVKRTRPGKVFTRETGDEPEEAKDEQPGKSLEDYFAQAGKWKNYGEKAYDYLQKRKEAGEAAAKGEKPKATKEAAVADTRKLGYLKAAADLVTDRPAWTIRWIQIEDVQLGEQYPSQVLIGSDVSSHPELNGKPTVLRVLDDPDVSTDPIAKLVLHFDTPAEQHQLILNMKNISIGDVIKPSDSLKVEDGKADISINGTFSADALDAPFTILVRDLKTDNETLNALKQIELPGKLYGSLLSPRIKIDLDDNLKSAVVDAAKEKAKEEAQKAASKELEKALESEEADELKGKASDALKGLF